MFDNYQDGPVEGTAKTERIVNMSLREIVSNKPSVNDFLVNISSANHNKDTSLEAEHVEHMPETQDQSSPQYSPVGSVRDGIEADRKSSGLGTLTSSAACTDPVHQTSIQNRKCISSLDDYISEELARGLMLTLTESSPTTGNISDSNTPTHPSVKNNMSHKTEHLAFLPTTSDDCVTESDTFSGSSTKQSPIAPKETGPMTIVPAYISPCISASVAVSQTLAKDNILAPNEILLDDSSTCLPYLSDVITSSTSHSEVSSSSNYISQSQLSGPGARKHEHSAGSSVIASTQTTTLEADDEHSIHLPSLYHDCSDEYESSTVLSPADHDVDNHVLEVPEDTLSSS